MLAVWHGGGYMSCKDSSTPLDCSDVAEASVESPSFQRNVTRNVLLRLVAEDRAESAPLPERPPEESR
jgi:hypothetical protein